MDQQIDKDIIILRLYRIFNIKEPDYITTQKLTYIFDWMEPRAGTVSLDIITTLRKVYKRESNLRTIDALYHELKLINMTDSGRYDVSSRKTPRVNERYYLGWRLG